MASVRKSITHKGTTRWQSVWQEPAPGGKTQRRTRNFASQKEARTHAQLMEREVERRGVGDPHKHTTERFLKGWQISIAERGEHSPTTLAAYREHLARTYPHIGHIPLERLSPADLDALYGHLLQRGGVARKTNADGSRDSQPLSPRSVLLVHRVLHTALEQARKWKLISENPARDAKAPTSRRISPRAFTADEVARLLAAAGERETYIILSTLLVTGIRRSELLGLAMDAIDLDAGTLTIRRTVLDVAHVAVLRESTKSDASARTLAIPPQLIALLREQKARVLEAALAWGKGYRREPMFLFARPDGEPLHPMNTTVRLRRVLRRAGITGRPPTHSWRHTAATLMIDAGANVKTVQTRLGHATPAFTLATYVHPVDERDRAAAEQLATHIKP